MELRLEVVVSSSIKRKKPWPRFCWLGQERESVFLLDDKRISEINMVSGRTKKRTPKLHHLLKSVVTMTSSHNGMWLCGLLVTGELFLWNKDKDLLKTTASVPEVVRIITSVQGNPLKVSLQVSLDGMRVLLVTKTGQVFLWECQDVKDLTGLRDGPVKGHWVHIHPLENIMLPSSQDKEASQHTIFVKTEEMGDTCLTAFVFTSGKKLVITFLKIQWEEGRVRDGSVGFSLQWTSKTYPMSNLTSACQPVKSRGALVPAFSPDGKLLAVVLNQRNPKATQVLFVSTQNFVTISKDLGGCGSKKMEIPSKYIRSYWVGSISWSPGGLFLACVLKRGSLLMLARLGGLLSLSTSGCNVDFGPAHFLPLHPLVTYRPPISAGKADASLSSSNMSERDVMRQRYSVTWHPQLMYLIVSDGYLATVTKVLDRPSPALLMKALLTDIKVDLEKASQRLDGLQTQAKAWLESVSSLNPDSSLELFNSTAAAGPNTTGAVFSATVDGSTLPLFLQDQQTLGGTKELFESVQAFFEDDSDVDGLPPGSHAEDDGRLEFASMFDTLHAIDTHSDTALVTSPDYERDSPETEKKPLLHRELQKIQTRLLTAWAFSMSLGNAIEHRARLLKHTLCCMVRFAALVHLIPSSGENNASSKLFHLIKVILSFLPWDSSPSQGPRCLGLIVEFSKQLIRLLLTPHPDSSHWNLPSQVLSQAMLVLQLVSDSLDHAYNLQQRAYWSSAEKEPPSQPSQLWFSDVFCVRLLQDDEKKSNSVQPSRPIPQRPSSRLLGIYQMLYNITKQYVEELKHFAGCEKEEQQLMAIMSQIQTALQAAGERLEGSPALLSYPGEHLFLCGSYTKSAQMWKIQICEESNKNCDRSVYQEKRLCLALLYSLLSQYQLKEAQELGDHMAQLVLNRAGHHKDRFTADSLPCSWLPANLHPDAACAVIQTLGRFMASYFTNQPLHILPPHNVAVLPPLHLPHGPSSGRLVPLCQEEVARAVRQQHLSQVWTVDYAQDLLLLGGLLPEAVWLASNLGDWKTAVSLSLAYTSYCKDHSTLARLRRRELHLPPTLKPESIFQTELECLLCIEADSKERKDKDDDRSLSDLLDGEDWDLLRVSIQDILKASVIAGVNVMSSPLSSLLDAAKELCSSLPALVPMGLYLPSPPLYCPQPSPNTQDKLGTLSELAEVSCRHKVSGILQRLLLLLRSGRCCYPAAQWYISHLRRARHLLHKIKKRYPYPSVPEVEKTFPEGLMRFVTRSGHFRHGPNKDGNLDADTIQIIICFRELCALCWMLHVRDQLSVFCRRYHSVRQSGRDEHLSGETEMNSACVDALHWACRFLPFSRFLNAEEILQDILLSFVSELPPVPLVADTLVQAFPDEEESVRVPLREKYNSLLQRLRQCRVLEEQKEEESELMMILIQDKFRQRKKHLGRLQRHIGPTVLHLWEKEDEEVDKGSKHGMAVLRQLSLGTSLSTSSLADCRLPPVCSDGDTAENTSEAISPEQPSRAKIRSKETSKVKEKKLAKKSAAKTNSVMKEEVQAISKENQQPSLPVVGTWEFELEDEEYLNFLELFLSYVLEKDSKDGEDSSNEPPLLNGFCSEIRERELHSLTFDVLTTIRRQRDGHLPARKHLGSDPPVFRAGCCYRPVGQGRTPERLPSSACSDDPVSRMSVTVTSQPGWRTGKQKGLFGLKQQHSVPLNRHGSEAAFITEQPSDCSTHGTSVTVAAVTELQQGLDPKLEAQFPKLGRLLEWMVRWADRRVLLGHHGKKKKEKRVESMATADEGVVIRVKASAPAILTSLSLLEHRYAALFGTDRCSAHMQVPQAQWIVAPVLQPAVGGPPERESSVDTGYPGSVNTPVNVVDHRVQQEEVAIGEQSSDEPEEETVHRRPLLTDQAQLTCDAELRQSHFLDDSDVTPEKEVTDMCSEALEVTSSCSSEDISGNICTPDMSLKLAELDCSVKTNDTTHHRFAGILHTDPHQEVPASPVDEPKTPVPTEVSDSPGTCLPNSTLNPASDQAHTSTAAAANQSSTHEAPPVRQHLGEDLFRLIQHINYMSLRDVLQASFSNVQNSMAQSNMISSLNNVPPSLTANSIPDPFAPRVQPTTSGTPQSQKPVPTSVCTKPHVSQTSDCAPVHQPAMQSSVRTALAAHQCHPDRKTLPTASGAGVNYQEMQPLSVQAGSPEPLLRESRRLIPCSEGLLATTDSNHTLRTTSVVLPLSGSAQNESAPHMLGLKLLQLHRPPLPQQRVPQCASTQPPQAEHTANPASLENNQHMSKHSDQNTSVKRGRDKKVGLKRCPAFNSSHDPTPRSSQHKFWPPEKPRNQEFSLLPPMLPAHTAAPVQGLRLLSFHSAPQSNITFPRLHFRSFSRPAVITAPMTETPVIKLLHIDSGPKIVMPMPAPSVQMTNLMSVEELANSVIRRQSAEENRLQLLRAEPSNKSTTGTTPLSSLNSRKRHKRREEKARKAEVRFKPNDSIIPTQEPAEVPVTEQPACAEDVPSAEDVSIPHGSSDAFLTGLTLPDEVRSASAELHAFESASKRPPECHDAFTNTEPRCSLTLVDKAVSAQISVPTSSPNSKESFQIDRGNPVQDSKETLQEPESLQDVGGRQFISILDLKDTGYHQNLEPHPSPGAPEVSSIGDSSPALAQLHFFTTPEIISGSAAASADDPRPSTSIPDDLLNAVTHSELRNPEESPSFCLIEPRIVSERSTSPPDHVVDDPSDSEIFRAIKSQSAEPRRTFSSSNTVWFSSRLSELDAQLAALQNIADHLETDFSNSNMLVNNVAPDVKSTTTAKKTVRLSVPLKAWAPRPDPDLLAGMNVFEEDDKDEEEAFQIDSCSPRGNTSYDLASLHSHRADSSFPQTPTRMKEEITETDDISWAEENLGQSGLSDTAVILDELVKEGYLSAADLDLTSLRTSHRSSDVIHSQPEQPHGRRMSQERLLPEDERRELRIWMRRKQRERLAAYQKHRASLREREHKPFSSSPVVQPTNRNRTTSLKNKEQNQKVMLLEHFKQRTHEACSFANNILASPATGRGRLETDGPFAAVATRSTSAPPAGSTRRAYSVSADDKRSLKSKSRQGRPHAQLQSAEVRGQPSEDYRRRLGLHRPVTVLPKDRLSQVTRRGMLAATKSPSEHQRRTALNKTFSTGAAGGGTMKEQMRRRDRGEENTELHGLQESESSRVLAGHSEDQDNACRAGTSWMEYLEYLSASTSSSLSLRDWAAIERMMAAEEG
ncbi:ciliogenesis and planar polarity effector 1 [Salarias fasciatus]|uniref:ciliogenesis and planar polarity effector 1 n=1 Tax=Salarias fasciatus TaxID=181472 RepID=UPI001176FA7D|nr:ciliogenesis and planar polarity effector 1 [Salarias fasciatus]